MKNLDNPQYYFNREWSRLDFDERVLYEAGEDNNPVLERLKFLAIVASNIEEFFMVRVAALKKQKEVGSSGTSSDLRSPEEQLAGIRERILRMLKRQYSLLYKEIVPEFKKHGIELLLDLKDIEGYKDVLQSYFESHIKKVLTPISVGPTHPFPNLNTGKIYLAVEISSSEESVELIEKSKLSFVQIPTNIQGRFIRIQDSDKYIPIENIVKLFISEIYTGYKVKSASIIRITRDADFSIDSDEISDLLTEIEEHIKRMHQRNVVKLEVEKNISPMVLKTLVKQTRVEDDYIYYIKGILNLNDLFEIYSRINNSELKDKHITPIYPYDFRNRDIFELIREKDCILYHPYHSYDPVVEFVERAAEDEDVLAIKLTLYRTSDDSSIVKALEKAAQNGKYVTILDELKARFDEKRNIQWARRLEDAGAHVIYGIVGLKTHAKALLVIRREKTGIRRYIHMATGNYNEKTARLYTDFSFFTSDDYIGEDVSMLFNLLTGFSMPTQWNYLAVAPLELRNRFISLIERETENAKNGGRARIIAKMNSLLDKSIVKALYAASIAGVKIELIVRGICALKPGIKGVSDNIKVRSIVGRFLEHPRIYYFYNGGDEEYYLSSADWMTRNLDRRVEILFPVRGRDECNFIKKIFEIQIRDNTNQWILNSDGTYELVGGKSKHDSFSETYEFIGEYELLKEKEKQKYGKTFEPVKNIDK